VGSEYFINSQELENKVRDLLPSQGGAGAGFDLSASTQIVPIIDLTESAEGSNVREDLQRAFSFKTISEFSVTGTATTTLVNNTGYFRVFGTATNENDASGEFSSRFTISDGSTTKIVWQQKQTTDSSKVSISNPFDFTVFLEAGHSLIGFCSDSGYLVGCTRQIASIDGTLTSP
jgi:hypothetical protein